MVRSAVLIAAGGTAPGLTILGLFCVYERSTTMAQHKPRKGTYRVRGNTGQPMDFPTRKRARNVAKQVQGGKVTKNGGGCPLALLAIVGTLGAAGTGIVMAVGAVASYVL